MFSRMCRLWAAFFVLNDPPLFQGINSGTCRILSMRVLTDEKGVNDMRALTKWMFVMAALTLFVTSVGCAAMQRPEEGQQGQQQTRPLRDTADRMGDQARETRPAEMMRVADNIADDVARLDRIDASTVMLMGRTAYVAVMFDKDYNGGMTNKIKDQVSKRVRQTDPSVDRVFVSANPDFVSQMGDYAQDIRNGRPVAGLMDTFMEMVERTFPAAR
jgi:YhcN/YlaJ family sporulation lipoprotein